MLKIAITHKLENNIPGNYLPWEQSSTQNTDLSLICFKKHIETTN